MKHSIIAFGLIIGIVALTMFVFEDEPPPRDNDIFEDEELNFSYSLPDFLDYDLFMARIYEQDTGPIAMATYGKGVEEVISTQHYFEGKEPEDLYVYGPYRREEDKVHLTQSHIDSWPGPDFDAHIQDLEANGFLQYAFDGETAWYQYHYGAGGFVELFMKIEDTVMHVSYMNIGDDRSQESIENITENLMRIIIGGMEPS
ncbi:hypothetical protein [Salisediminibacterium selenitireducens]|uniref:Uncharacterized protein n=1 Tax=Bacillus selenitireducens (strain ATCC 700615 / DSM 15326 / MLS10) TaxID=439292 RepID=D6XYT0_BACIE|nr:hypothetical protein [Salisediminibacterium selenitireducens]ADH98238.1 hypothetical protein Bsel_0704 [[Bacillus] selenitireducens MLS10]